MNERREVQQTVGCRVARCRLSRTRLLMVSMLCCAGISLHADEELSQPRRAEAGQLDETSQQADLVQMTVMYEKAMLVVVSQEGVAGIRFNDAFERVKDAKQTYLGVPYHFTFVSPEGQTQEGNGEVYETYTDGKYDRGRLDFQAGPVQVRWSRGGDELGWIYYDPARNPIWCVDTPYAKQLVGAITLDARRTLQE